MFIVKYQCAFHVKNYENSFKNSIPDSFPFLLDRAFYPLLHQKNSSIHYTSNVLFIRGENNSKPSQVMAIFKAS